MARSATPLHAIDNRTGTALRFEELQDRLSDADVLCIGEHHDDPRHHFAQLKVLEGVFARAPRAGRQVGVGFEMFEHGSQQALDDYANGQLSNAALQQATQWERSWGFDFSLYRPLLEMARDGHARLLALNAERALVRQVARTGLAGLTAAERARIPEVDLGNAEHRALFDRAMSGHPMGDADPQRYYEAQVVWDETMANAVADWTQSVESATQAVIFAGLGHCHRSAIPERIERRVSISVVSVRPRERSAERADTGEPEPRFDYDLILERESPTPDP